MEAKHLQYNWRKMKSLLFSEKNSGVRREGYIDAISLAGAYAQEKDSFKREMRAVFFLKKHHKLLGLERFYSESLRTYVYGISMETLPRYLRAVKA
jgi:hypothetical protein